MHLGERIERSMAGLLHQSCATALGSEADGLGYSRFNWPGWMHAAAASTDRLLYGDPLMEIRVAWFEFIECPRARDAALLFCGKRTLRLADPG